MTKKAKKTISVILNIVGWVTLVIAVVVLALTIICANVTDRTDRGFLGYKIFIVQSDSMSATDFSAGDLIFVKTVEPSELKEGDIISFVSTNGASYGEVVTHKIRSLVTDSGGNAGFITYGTTTGADDESIVYYSNVIGKYSWHIYGAGNFCNYLKTGGGYVVCILIPFLVIMLDLCCGCAVISLNYAAEKERETEASDDGLEDLYVQ